MSVNSHLTNLASELVLSQDEKFSVATSISNLQSKLDARFGSNVISHFQFGSSTRGTILPRKADERSDIDYMVVFDTSDGQKKPQTYLDRLKKFVEAKYSSSNIKQSHPTIILSLNHINFELVPAVYNYGYQIPSPASSWSEWMYTDPAAINKSLQDKNKAENFQIKPLVRLVKYWNANKGYPFASFSLEEFIINMSCWGDSAQRDYFYRFWNNVSYKDSMPQYNKDKVDSAKKHAKQAKEYEDSDMPYSAESEIKKIVPEL